MADCCPTPAAHEHEKKTKKIDFLFWGSLIIISGALLLGHFSSFALITEFSLAIQEFLHKIWWGVLLGIIAAGILDGVPRELIMALLGKGGSFSGILRATGAGVLLDLCSHGILFVGMKLYERGASLGQTMAFLIASPWNSFSLTLILWGLIGFKWTLIFLLLSMGIALLSGMIFERLVARGVLPKNPNTPTLPENFHFGTEFKKYWQGISWQPKTALQVFWRGLKGSQMILRWILFGTILAALVQILLSAQDWQTFFGPTLLGLGLTLFFATILEVCSEGSTPIAAQIFNLARAPGNAFAFLMTGVATDYTEVMVLRETTKSWKVALFLPLVTLPQVLILAIILNQLPV